jgi:hypothetical protein
VLRIRAGEGDMGREDLSCGRRSDVSTPVYINGR